MLIVDKSKIV